MVTNLFILWVSIFFIVQGAIFSTKYAVKFAENFQVSKFIVGLIIVAVISILPETFISINSVLEGQPGLGLWTLFGSNVADLTLAFAIIVLFSWRKDIKIENKILKTDKFYPFFLLLPILLWLDWHYWWIEWIGLIIVGVFFYYFAFKNGVNETPEIRPKGSRIINFLLLLWSISLLLLGAHFAVISWIDIANAMWINPVLVGILVIWLGTVIPELLFAFQAVKKYNDSLAVGDILWTVLADATIVVGIIALISPFYFPQKIIYVTGAFMLVASILTSYFMHTGKVITKKEWILMLLFWLTFVLTEYFVNK